VQGNTRFGAHRPSPRGAVSLTGVAIALATFAIAGCQGASSPAAQGTSASATAPATSKSPAPPAQVSVLPVDDATTVPLNQPVTVTATAGHLTSVTVTDPTGTLVPGALADGGLSWTTTGALAPSALYHVSATAVNADGATTTTMTSFTTLTPAKVLGTKVAPLDGETVGVGMPIVVYFTSPVTDRAAVERALSVTSSIPVVGAWHWYGNTEVHYRPQTYWPAGDVVTVNADVAGVDAGNGVWGTSSRVVHFRVGDSHVTEVDAKTDTMTVSVNGEVVKTAAVSLGRDQYPTTSGIHVVLEKQPSVVMDSATVGIPKGSPDYYYEVVNWDVRISWSGEFVHSAPWSVASQGHVNVSHGCVNASPAVAQWFYNLSRRGDIVQIVNTPRPLQTGNGWTDWNMTWAQWVAGSALGTDATTLPEPAGAPTPSWLPTPAPLTTLPPNHFTAPPAPTTTTKPTPTKTPTPSATPTKPAASPPPTASPTHT
jgi:lipoprotein-anchoring transpeptidase ErfK/SrfK